MAPAADAGMMAAAAATDVAEATEGQDETGREPSSCTRACHYAPGETPEHSAGEAERTKRQVEAEDADSTGEATPAVATIMAGKVLETRTEVG